MLGLFLCTKGEKTHTFVKSVFFQFCIETKIYETVHLCFIKE